MLQGICLNIPTAAVLNHPPESFFRDFMGCPASPLPLEIPAPSQTGEGPTSAVESHHSCKEQGKEQMTLKKSQRKVFPAPEEILLHLSQGNEVTEKIKIYLYKNWNKTKGVSQSLILPLRAQQLAVKIKIYADGTWEGRKK